MENVVPTLTFTSIFDEPSSGSNTTMYFAPGEPPCTTRGCSFSSEASMATLSRTLNACISISLAYTSSFCCTSPCTFFSPAEPRMSDKPARRTLASINFVASVMPESSQENSPETPLKRRCSRRMCCWTVTIGGWTGSPGRVKSAGGSLSLTLGAPFRR